MSGKLDRYQQADVYNHPGQIIKYRDSNITQEDQIVTLEAWKKVNNYN